MDQNRIKRNQMLGAKIVKELTARNMEAYYTDSKEEALKKALELIPEGSRRLLGRDVLRGADHHAVLSDLLLIGGIAHSEIRDFDVAVAADHDVRRLDVTMHHTMAVRHEQSSGRLDKDRQQLQRIHTARILVVQISQRLRRHIFHNEEADAVMLVVFKQRGDIRMRKIGGIMRFCTQTAQFGLGVGDVGT